MEPYTRASSRSYSVVVAVTVRSSTNETSTIGKPKHEMPDATTVTSPLPSANKTNNTNTSTGSNTDTTTTTINNDNNNVNDGTTPSRSVPQIRATDPFDQAILEAAAVGHEAFFASLLLGDVDDESDTNNTTPTPSHVLLIREQTLTATLDCATNDERKPSTAVSWNGGDTNSAIASFMKRRIRAARCTSGCSALHWAAGCNQASTLRFLLVHLDVFVVAVDGTSAIVDDDDCVIVPRRYKAAGRTPLHYAARNGCIDAARVCMELEWGEGLLLHARAKHGVTAFQLALFQNQLEMAQWLVAQETQQQGCDVHQTNNVNNNNDTNMIFQTNDFGCNALHWLAICPSGPRSGPAGANLVPTAQWLYTMQQQQKQKTISQTENCQTTRVVLSTKHQDDPWMNLFAATQKQGHSAWHKAAWLGHTALLRYLHDCHDVWDDQPDRAGNYGVDLAIMGHEFRRQQHQQQSSNTDPSSSLDGDAVDYIRQHASRSAQHSCDVLGISLQDAKDPVLVRRVYLQQAKRFHPDRQKQQQQLMNNSNLGVEGAISKETPSNPPPDPAASVVAFDAVCRAYRHLTIEQGRGLQKNPAHDAHKLLRWTETTPLDGNVEAIRDDLNKDCFKAQLLAVLLEYGEAGLDVSNLKKKWKQIWKTDFPVARQGSLTKWIRQHLDDIVELRLDDKGFYRAHAKSNKRHSLNSPASMTM